MPKNSHMVTSLRTAPVARPWSLLDHLKASLASLLAADALLLLVLIWAHDTQYSVVKTIGKDSAPSVIAAQDIKVEMAAMDAEAANELLAPPGQGKAAADDYNKHRQEAGRALIEAAKNITYAGEEQAIKDIQFGLGEYEAKVQRARDAHERNDPQAFWLYRDATLGMNTTLFHAADELNDINFNELETAYREDGSKAKIKRQVVVVIGLIALGLLLWVQWDLSRKVRRLINPALALATVLTLSLLSSTYGHLSRSAIELSTAKEEAFDSLHALWQARAIAFAANADESKYFLAGADGSDEKSFDTRAHQISSGSNSPSVMGFLDKELANITFDGEKEAAQETIADWNLYLKIDSQIRQFKKSGQTAAAIALCLGKNQNESDWAFEQFDKSLMHTIEINQKAFEKSRDSAFAELDHLVTSAAIITAVIVLCCGLGLFFRIREFL